MIRLELPHPKYKATYLDAVNEIQDKKRTDEAHGVKDGPGSDSVAHYLRWKPGELETEFDKFVQSLMDQHNGVNLKEGWVPSTEYWIINDDEKYCGRISLRHRLNKALEEYGGHIGYDVIPSERGKKHAQKALKLCLQEAKKRGLAEVLLTVDKDNGASIKTIQNSGGVPDPVPEGSRTLKYRIRL